MRLCHTDGADDICLHLQSTRRVWKRFENSIAGRQEPSLLEYQEFHNSFNVQAAFGGDRFTGFKMGLRGLMQAEIMRNGRSNRWVMDTESQFTTPKKGYWGYGTIDFITPQAASANFAIQAKDGSRSSLRVYGTTGGRLSEERYSNQTYKAYQFPVEIALASNRLKVWISNGSRTIGGSAPLGQS